MSINLATKLREGTKKSHTMAENVGFVKCFLKGVVEKTSYRKLVGNLYFVYSAMEEEMERQKQHPVVSKIYFSELNRKQSLEQDLFYYYGANWREQVAPSAAAKAYVQRIHEISATAPELLVAQSYTRYLGDLSDIPDEKEFKANYRQAMNELPIDEATAERIVDEANAAFGMNMKMFMELEGNLIKAVGQMLFNTLTRKRGGGSTELATAD
ncbi:MAG: heme oxygenase (biliverdin-producing) [Oscillatoriales cyanobacterium]|nr:MAG: heme oxygenase (biliverdin-producing) [Oscillatoriales cyanobacterium]